MNNQQKFFISIAVMVVALFAVASASNTGKAISAPETCVEEIVCTSWQTYSDSEVLCTKYDTKIYDVCISYNVENGIECNLWDKEAVDTCVMMEPIPITERVCESWKTAVTCLE